MGATYGFEFICFLLENPRSASLIPVGTAMIAMYMLGGYGVLWLPVFVVLSVLLPITVFLAYLVIDSYSHDAGQADWSVSYLCVMCGVPCGCCR